MRITSKFARGMRFDTDIRGHHLTVDVPESMGGQDTGPMPPELVATALGTCVGIYAVQFCNKHQISTEGLVVHTDWEKITEPARIGELHVSVEVPAGIPAEKRGAFMKTVEQCMVHNTLCNQPQISLKLTGHEEG